MASLSDLMGVFPPDQPLSREVHIRVDNNNSEWHGTAVITTGNELHVPNSFSNSARFTMKKDAVKLLWPPLPDAEVAIPQDLSREEQEKIEQQIEAKKRRHLYHNKCKRYTIIIIEEHDVVETTPSVPFTPLNKESEAPKEEEMNHVG